MNSLSMFPEKFYSKILNYLKLKKQIIKKVLSSLQNLANTDNEKYLSFYKTFGAVLKEGFHFDHEQHEVLSDLVRFKSSKTEKDGFVSFKEYIERKAEAQREIYYLTGPSYEAVERSPHLEALTSRGIEVLFLTDPIDEWFLMSYLKHGEYNLKSINKGDLDLTGVGKESGEEKNNEETPLEELAGLLDFFRTKLADDIKEVKISKRLRESACCLVADEHGMSAHMERIMKASGQNYSDKNKRILEINPSHPLIKNLAERKNKAEDEAILTEWIEVLHETALLSEGSPVKNPGTFAKRLTKIMELASGK